jgi:hypothetical protein
MMHINWAKVLVASLIMQLPLIPLFGKSYLPFEERTIRRLGIASRVLVGPIYAFIFWALDVSIHEAILMCILFMILAGIQAVFFVLTYQGKKRPLKENGGTPPIMTEITEEAIRKSMRRLWFLWMGQIVASFVYIRICHILGDKVFPAFRPALPIAYVQWAFCCAALGSLALSYYLRTSLLRVSPGKSIDRIEKRAIKMNTSPILVKYNSAFVVSVAMVQYAPILSVVLFFLGGGIKALYVFVGASMATWLLLRPNRRELDRLSVRWLETTRDNSH